MERGGSATDVHERDERTVKAVETSFAIVESLREHEPAGVTELAEVTGRSKSNVYKHLETLREQGVVVKRDDGYRSSLLFLEFGGFVRERYAPVRRVKPKVTELARETAEVGQFMVENRGYSVVAFKEVGENGVFMRTRVGTHLALHRTASGKAMLATMDDDRVDAVIDDHGLERATEHTITDRAALFEELDRVDDRGYAVNRGESTEGLHAVAAPVEGEDGLLGACAVSGPSHRMQEKIEREDLPTAVINKANEIELNILHG